MTKRNNGEGTKKNNVQIKLNKRIKSGVRLHMCLCECVSHLMYNALKGLFIKIMKLKMENEWDFVFVLSAWRLMAAGHMENSQLNAFNLSSSLAHCCLRCHSAIVNRICEWPSAFIHSELLFIIFDAWKEERATKNSKFFAFAHWSIGFGRLPSSRTTNFIMH